MEAAVLAGVARSIAILVHLEQQRVIGRRKAGREADDAELT